MPDQKLMKHFQVFLRQGVGRLERLRDMAEEMEKLS